ncbi:hypothetical protein [Lewinella sp. LCG006]|uniref:hypothetical protein n=1 Tax=Lewinella sp. LCG006 TaxID=3231911 RepID=UPI00345F5DA8
MKRLLPLSLVLLFVLPFSLVAQRSKWLKKQNVRVATTFNYLPAGDPFFFTNFFSAQSDDLILNFITANSGTFIIEEGDILYFTRTKTNEAPSQILGIGASVQFMSQQATFHEFSLTKLSFFKSSFKDDYFLIDSTGNPRLVLRYGEDQQAAAYAFRYEFGKYFGDQKYGNLHFGIAGSIEPSLYTYRRTPNTNSFGQFFPFEGKIFALEVALIPMISARLSKKVTLDIKAIPNILIADFGSIKEENPIIPESQKVGLRDFDPPVVNMAFSVLLRYQIQEAKRSRRRKP